MRRADEDDRRLDYETVGIDEFRRDPQPTRTDAGVRPVGLARDESGRTSHTLLPCSDYIAMLRSRDLWLKSQLDTTDLK